ncbi:MAG: peptidase U32 family protein, partial [Clostridium sp.]|uniref:peptidase U32 family protein n=1 Tax=Clostridium sp. TaxID=1506 RepID=UPI003F36F467
LPIHISTQANTMNYEACNVWESLGAERVVLGRECSLEEIKTIRENISPELELEAFVHGSMCIAYSGRCLLSSYMAGRQSNLGACSQSCRWNYALVEEKRPNEYFPISEDSNGTYIMNSKDLCMIDHLPELLNAGISSLKIEGRNKSEYYVALVVNAYRQAIDMYYNDPENYKLPRDYKDELDKVNHRKYDTGFFFREPREDGIIYDSNFHIKDYDMVARVLSYDEKTSIATCIQRNKFVKGETLEVLAPGTINQSFVAEEIYDEKGNELDMCQHPNMIFKIKTPFKLEEDDFFRARVIRK